MSVSGELTVEESSAIDPPKKLKGRGWRSGVSTCLPPVCTGFESRTQKKDYWEQGNKRNIKLAAKWEISRVSDILAI